MDEPQTVAAERTAGNAAALSGLKFSKGHGTGNDFVLIADPNGTLSIAPSTLRRSVTGTAALAETG